MNIKISEILEKIINLCFPMTCVCCENFVESEGLCKDCWDKIHWLSEPICEICGKQVDTEIKICSECIRQKPIFDKAVSVFSYDAFSKHMILNFKDNDCTYLAPLFAKWIERIIKKFSYEIDVIIPVPISFKRRLLRKYNQTELLAYELHKLSNIKYEPRSLKKNKDTVNQKKLSKKFRLKNLAKSFEVNPKYKFNIKDKVILLIDDVITTGATANECARPLKNAGALKVYVATIARVDLHNF